MNTPAEIPVCPHQDQFKRFAHEQVMSSQGFTVDAGILSILERLWDAGCVTICSCQGDKNIKHGLLGPRHDHPAYITFETAADAALAYQIVVEDHTDAYLVCEKPSHGLNNEHILSFTM